MSNIKGILFDFNGTLFFDSKLHMEAFRRYFKAHGIAVPTDEYMVHNIFGRTNEQIVRQNCDPNATEADVAAFSEEKEILYRDMCLSDPQSFHLVEGAEELLDALLASKIPYCIATGAGLDNMKFYFEHFGLSRWFSLDKNVVYDDGSFNSKPAPDIYLLAAKKIGLAPEECAVFEDGTSGMISATRANTGVLVAIFDPTLPDPLTAETKPVRIVHDLTDWKCIVENDLGISLS